MDDIKQPLVYDLGRLPVVCDGTPEGIERTAKMVEELVMAALGMPKRVDPKEPKPD